MKEKSVRKTKFYKGELEQIHGVAEAADFIARKKYIEEEDSDGDTVFVKKQESAVDKKIHSTEAEAKNQSRTTQDAQTALFEQMEAWFNDDQGALLDKGDKALDKGGGDTALGQVPRNYQQPRFAASLAFVHHL